MFNRPNDDLARFLAACLLTLAIVWLILIPATTARAVIADTWAWPLDPPWRIERGYVAPPTPYGIGHRGIDLAAGQDTLVLAPAPGIVLFAGTVVDRGVISIEHGNGVISSYEPVNARVVVGDRVQTGDAIGVVSGLHASSPGAGNGSGGEDGNGGGSGFCTCLHVGTRLNGQYLSPLAFLSAIDRAVLLPWRE